MLPQARLVVIGWGEDLDFAKNQVAQIGLADSVLFLPTVGKRRLVHYLRAADALMEQFVLGYYGASALEAMACGKPVIMRIEQEQYDALVEVRAPPVLSAENGTDVERHLRGLYNKNRGLCRGIGEQTERVVPQGTIIPKMVRDLSGVAGSNGCWNTFYRSVIRRCPKDFPMRSPITTLPSLRPCPAIPSLHQPLEPERCRLEALEAV